MFYVYILASRPNGTLYTGSTDDLLKRVVEHREKLRGGFKTAHPAPGLRIDRVLGHLVASGYGPVQSGPPGRQTPER